MPKNPSNAFEDKTRAVFTLSERRMRIFYTCNFHYDDDSLIYEVNIVLFSTCSTLNTLFFERVDCS